MKRQIKMNKWKIYGPNRLWYNKNIAVYKFLIILWFGNIYWINIQIFDSLNIKHEYLFYINHVLQHNFK